MSEDEQNGRWETTPGELKAEVRRLRGVIDKVRRDADWATAGDDPHDWRKGLEIIKTDLDEENRRPRGSS